MAEPVPAHQLRKLIAKNGIAVTAKILHRKYATVRNMVTRLGIIVIRGRRPDKTLPTRNTAIREQRKRQHFLHDIGEKFGIGRERVRQILEETGGDPLKKRTSKKK